MLAFQYSICIVSLICTGTKINNFLMLLTLCISGPVLVNSFCLLWFNFHTRLIFFPVVLENPLSCTHTMYMTIPKNNSKINNYNLFSHTRSSILPPPLDFEKMNLLFSQIEFYNNWANPWALIGRELWSMRV